MLGGVKCFQSERISRHPLQFPHLTHQNFSFISVVDRFGRIFLSVFHDKVIVPSPHTPELHIDCMFPCQVAAKYAPFVLSCPPTVQRLPRSCRRRCTGFPSVAAWCFASSEMQYSFSVPNGPFIVFDLTLWQVPFEQQGLSPFSSLLYILTVYRNLTYLIQYPAEQA